MAYLLNINRMDLLLYQTKTGLEYKQRLTGLVQNDALICSDPWPHMTDISIHNDKLSASLRYFK